MSVFLFDIDGTLLSSGGAGRLAMERALTDVFHVNQEIPPGMLSGRSDRGIIRNLFELNGIAESEENIARFVENYLVQLPEALGERSGSILPGVVELIDRLKDASAHIGLLTGNMVRGARIKLSHHGLMDHFPFGAFGDLRLTRDEIAHDALQIVREHVHVDVQPEQIWIIGDTPRDIACARAIGAKVIAVATGVHEHAELHGLQPDVVVNDLTDVASLQPALEF